MWVFWFVLSGRGPSKAWLLCVCVCVLCRVREGFATSTEELLDVV